MKRPGSWWLILVLAGSVSADDRYPFAGGTVVRLSSQQITIQTGATARNFALTNQTALFNGTERISLDKLKPGTPVRLNYFTNATGQAFIRRLKIAQPPTDDMVDKTQ